MIELVTTADGSKSLYNPAFQENYHSKHGALQESLHVFIKEGLEYYLSKNSVNEVRILEMGFGTGLNFFLSANECIKHSIKLHYTAVEKYPISLDLFTALDYSKYVEDSKLYQEFIATYRAEGRNNYTFNFNEQIYLTLLFEDIEQIEISGTHDLIYYDAFSPTHQLALWEEPVLKKFFNATKPGGIFVTYSITGALKRLLKKYNFVVEKPPGALNKREMCRGIKE